jgi:hypothetical protein
VSIRKILCGISDSLSDRAVVFMFAVGILCMVAAMVALAAQVGVI